MHCMTVSLAQGGAGLGTVWGRELATHMAELAHNINTMTAVVRQMNNHIASMDTSIAIMQPDMSAITARLDTMPPY